MTRKWFDELRSETVIVHTVNGGPSFRCNTLGVYDDGLLVGDLMNLDLDAQVVEAGTHFILRDQIQRVQLPEAT